MLPSIDRVGVSGAQQVRGLRQLVNELHGRVAEARERTGRPDRDQACGRHRHWSNWFRDHPASSALKAGARCRINTTDKASRRSSFRREGSCPVSRIWHGEGCRKVAVPLRIHQRAHATLIRRAKVKMARAVDKVWSPYSIKPPISMEAGLQRKSALSRRSRWAATAAIRGEVPDIIRYTGRLRLNG